MMKLILASASIGREFLLKGLKIPYQIVPSKIDEDKIVGKNLVGTIKMRAKLKGEAVADLLSRSPKLSLDSARDRLKSPRSLKEKTKEFLILSADTEVILGNQLLGKPKDYKDAVKMLKMLSEKTHEVVSAYYIVRHSGERSDSRIPAISKDSGQARMTNKIWQGYDRSFVTFRKLQAEDIKLYLSITDYTRYTGSYALVASPQNFITQITGSISNVIGLPLEKVIPVLRLNRLL